VRLARLCRDSLVLAAPALLYCAGSAHAQRATASVDVGAVALRYADTVNATAAALTPNLQIDWPHGIAEALGTLSQFAGGGWSAQGSVSASLFTPRSGGFFGELSGSAGGSTHQDATRTGEALTNGRIHFARSGRGAFVGVGGGTTWDGSGWRRVTLAEIGAWADFQMGTALLRISPASVDDSTKYVDGQLTVNQTRERLDLSALAATRWGSRLPFDPTGTRTWASVTVTAWATPALAIVGAAGTYPVDPTQGFPGGRFVSLGIRLAPGHRNPRNAAASLGIDSVRADVPESFIAAADAFRVEARRQGVVLLRVHAPSAGRVEINGDFTGWTPVDLQRTSEGWWTRALPIAPGQYEMNLRLDGGAWIVPPGLLEMKDEFGGSVGLLTLK
jgi:hypothetical protein